jgi:hypothetical protein
MGLDFMCFTIPLLLTVGFNIPSAIKRSANEEEGRGRGGRMRRVTVKLLRSEGWADI